MGSRIVAIGASLGGLRAVETLLEALPGDFSLPIALVLHRQKDLSGGLARLLQNHCAMRVCEVEDKEFIEGGRVYLAPRDYHLLAEQGAFSLSLDEPVNFARPSIDVFLESVADVYRDEAICVILTGSNTDGAYGAAKIQEYGGRVIVQEPSSAQSSTLPQAILGITSSEMVLELTAIATYLKRLDQGRG